jgi:hypothetical protein
MAGRKGAVMQLLQIPTVQRTQLADEGLLAINSSGQEVLHGLSFEESQFLVDCAAQPANDAATLDRCNDLALRHERARLRIATVDDESTGDEERPVIAAKF